MGVGVECEPCGVVSEHTRHRLDVHSVLECNGGECVPEVCVVFLTEKIFPLETGRSEGLPVSFTALCRILLYYRIKLFSGHREGIVDGNLITAGAGSFFGLFLDLDAADEYSK